VGKKIVIKSEDKRLVYGEVYVPMMVDTDDEAMTAEDIEIMAHDFLSSGRVKKIDVSHNEKESGCAVVESFIVRQQDPDGFSEGAWVLGVKIEPADLWKAVKSGELNGFSFKGPVMRVPAEVEVNVARKITGSTEKTAEGDLLPPHDHSVIIELTPDGKIIPTKTGETLGHGHRITKATATEREMDHSHRLVMG